MQTGRVGLKKVLQAGWRIIVPCAALSIWLGLKWWPLGVLFGLPVAGFLLMPWRKYLGLATVLFTPIYLGLFCFFVSPDVYGVFVGGLLSGWGISLFKQQKWP